MAETEQTPDDQSDEKTRAQEVKEAHERGQEKMKELEEDPPENLEDWPTDEAKYTTFGGGEGDHGYEEGPEVKLGPSGLRHHEDGSVSIDGEQVDNPEEYKGDPIPGGPTDPNASRLAGEDDTEVKDSDSDDESKDDSGDDS
jgi:hypothetical protein